LYTKTQENTTKTICLSDANKGDTVGIQIDLEHKKPRSWQNFCYHAVRD